MSQKIYTEDEARAFAHAALETLKALAAATPAERDVIIANLRGPASIIQQDRWYSNGVDLRPLSELHARTPSTPTFDEAMASPGVSFWLKDALVLNWQRDPVDAYYDAELLARMLKARMDQALGRPTP